MLRLLTVAMLAIPAAALAQPAEDEDGRTIRRVVIYGNDACPPSSANEVVVCSRRPERERDRIPSNLRETPPDPQGPSWAERARRLDDASPNGLNTCSPVGPGGNAGCLQQQLERYRDEKEDVDGGPEA